VNSAGTIANAMKCIPSLQLLFGLLDIVSGSLSKNRSQSQTSTDPHIAAMGCAPSTNARDPERWSQQGQPVQFIEHRRSRSPGGRVHNKRKRTIERGGNLFGDFDLGGGLNPPQPSGGGGQDRLIPPMPGTYPNPQGGPDIVIGNEQGAPSDNEFVRPRGGRGPGFEDPTELDPDLLDELLEQRARFNREHRRPFGRPSPFAFDYDDFPLGRRPSQEDTFVDDSFLPQHRPFGRGYRPFPPAGFEEAHHCSPMKVL
jgi:hypothetical protein